MTQVSIRSWLLHIHDESVVSTGSTDENRGAAL
jgi:hypothetical protein